MRFGARFAHSSRNAANLAGRLIESALSSPLQRSDKIDANHLNEPRIRHAERDDGGGPPRWPWRVPSRNPGTVRLADAHGFAPFKSAPEANPQLKIDASTTLDFFSKQSEGMAQVICVIGIVAGGIGFIGGLFPAARAATMPATTAPREL